MITSGAVAVRQPLSGKVMDLIILSNNGSLEDAVSGIPVCRVEGDCIAVYDAAGRALENGYELVSSPLPPNVPMIRSPVRSVILRKTARKYDAQGILTLEKARERNRILGIENIGRFRKDQEYIDRDHLARAIAELAELDEG